MRIQISWYVVNCTLVTCYSHKLRLNIILQKKNTKMKQRNDHHINIDLCRSKILCE